MMKIAFTAYGNSWREQVDIRFGRAKGFFIVDTETDTTSYIDNSKNVAAAQDAGTGSAQTIAGAGINVLIAGKVGPKAGAVLKAAGIRCWEVSALRPS
ncbi:MAG TPA: dinitrogenase iron-molybdenum cofactor biosynthesis protein, partial [Calditrichaeota bacterium]|nr:dinitrogenase iron-molybdenum cofactor biosynthesis protein [Calditrichota bacterium]